jgi:hypothetical protein
MKTFKKMTGERRRKCTPLLRLIIVTDEHPPW